MSGTPNKHKKNGGAQPSPASSSSGKRPAPNSAPATPPVTSKQKNSHNVDPGGSPPPDDEDEEEDGIEDDSIGLDEGGADSSAPATGAPVEKARGPSAASSACARAPHCPHCYTDLGTHVAEDRRTPAFGPCPFPAACGLIMQLEWGCPQNAAIRDRAEAKDKKGTASSPAAPDASDVSRREQEFAKLASIGRDYPLYAKAEQPVSDAEIDKILAGAWMSEDFEGRPPGLLAFVRSGKITVVSVLKPRTIEEVTAEALATAVATPAANLAYTLPCEPIKDLAEFDRVMLRVILQCLIGLDRATAEWLALYATVAQLDKQYGWVHALQYMNVHLPYQTKARAPFGEVSRKIADGIQAKFVTDIAKKAEKKAPPAASASAAQQPARGPGKARPGRSGPDAPCQNYNFARAGCNAKPCSQPHTCMYTVVANQQGVKCPGGPEHDGFHCPAHIHKAKVPAPPRAEGAPRSVVKREAAAREE